jgi:hypothetical protein
MSKTKPQISALVSLLALSFCASAESTDLEMWEEPSHQLVFNRDGTRVLDIRIVPGVLSEFHSHRYATVYVVVQGAKIKAQRAGGDWVDLSERDRQSAGAMMDRPEYFASPYVHRVENVDDRALHLVSVVNERDVGATSDVAPAEPGELIDNAWFMEHRLALAAGETSDVLRFSNEAVLVQFDGGAGHVIEEGVAHSPGTAPGAFSWHAADSAFQVSNNSDYSREYVIVEVKSAN